MVLKKIYLCRHAETIWNTPQQQHLQGWLDSKLTLTGLKQSIKLKRYLKKHEITKIYSSPLGRCIKTLHPYTSEQKMSYICSEELKEINYGLFDGLPSLFARKNNADFFSIYDNSDDLNCHKIRFPKGESRDDASKRFLSFLFDIIGKEEDNPLIMTHGGILSSVFNSLFKLHKSFKNCEVVILYYDSNKQIYLGAKKG